PSALAKGVRWRQEFRRFLNRPSTVGAKTWFVGFRFVLLGLCLDHCWWGRFFCGRDIFVLRRFFLLLLDRQPKSEQRIKNLRTTKRNLCENTSRRTVLCSQLLRLRDLF